MSTDTYILDDNGKPVKETDTLKWGTWLQDANRRVGIDFVGKVKISTVFLGLDHNLNTSGPPTLWETMVFGGKLDQKQDRCSGTREDAKKMHDKMVTLVKKKEKTNE